MQYMQENIPCLSYNLHVLEASEDDGEDGGNDADQVDQVHLVREELALVRADQQPQEVPGTDFWKTNICIHIPLKTHSLDDEEGGGHVVDDVQHHQHLLLLADRLDEENT